MRPMEQPPRRSMVCVTPGVVVAFDYKLRYWDHGVGRVVFQSIEISTRALDWRIA